MDLETIRKILSEHADILEEFGVDFVRVFGAVARGDATSDSDVDLLVTFSKPIGLFDFVRLKDRLRQLMGTKIDLTTPDALHHRLKDRILAEAVHAA
jgi:uncharacterized protein